MNEKFAEKNAVPLSIAEKFLIFPSAKLLFISQSAQMNIPIFESSLDTRKKFSEMIFAGPPQPRAQFRFPDEIIFIQNTRTRVTFQRLIERLAAYYAIVTSDCFGSFPVAGKAPVRLAGPFFSHSPAQGSESSDDLERPRRAGDKARRIINFIATQFPRESATVGPFCARGEWRSIYGGRAGQKSPDRALSLSLSRPCSRRDEFAIIGR